MSGRRIRIRAWGFAAVVLAVAAGPALAQDTARADRIAYDAAIRCFLANGIVVGDAREAKDRVKEAKFEAKARESFDIAGQLGQKLGYSGSRINQDFGLAQTADMPKLMRDPSYFRTTAATCRALGLM